MKRIIQQRPISMNHIFSNLGNPQDGGADVVYDILDESGNFKGAVHKVFSVGKQEYTVFDNKGDMIISVHRNGMKLPPTCDICIVNGIQGTLWRNMIFGTLGYETDFGGYCIKGDFFGREYDVVQNGNSVMRISMETPNLMKRYILDILNSGDELIALGLVVALDGVNYSKTR